MTIPLISLQDRQRATMISIKNIYAAAWKTTQGMIHLMSETSDEEVNFGSFDIDAIPHTDSDHAWSTHA